MTNKEEALRMALEALDGGAFGKELERVVLALRAALAQPETVSPGGGFVPAVPVAVYGYCPECGGAGVMRERRPNGDDKCTNGHKYPSSKALAQPEQEPVAWLHNGKLHEFDPSDWATGPVTPLYTSPPAKPWVGLTDEDKEELDEKYGDDALAHLNAVEAKLRSKNT